MWDDMLQRKRAKLESQHRHRRGRPPRTEASNSSLEERKEYEHNLKPTIGKPALWSVASSTATTTLVKRVPMVSAKMVHPPQNGSVRVPCGSIGNSGDRTAVLRPGGKGHRQGKWKRSRHI